MLGHQDEITTSYRKCCADLKEKLKIGLNKIYNNYKDGCQGIISDKHDNYMDDALNSLVLFERKLLQYIRIKQQYQSENKTFQMKIKELQLDLKSKDLCILKLKEDIVSHYVQIEFLRKHNERLERDLQNNRKKLDQWEASKDWLKKQIFCLNVDTKYKRELISDEIYLEQLNKSDKQKEKQPYEEISYKTNDDDTTCSRNENIDEFRKFHVKLMEVYHENIFLKQALQKMKNLSDREDRLNRILKSSHEIPTVTKPKEQTKEKKNDENTQILQLNSIIDCMKVTVLRLEFEKRNMELLVFKISGYFMKMKDIQTNLKLMLSDKNRSVLKKEMLLCNRSIEDKKFIQELITTIRSLKFEKLRMEIEHHEELSTFTEKFSKMQFILHDIKAVCENIPNDSDPIQQISKDEVSKTSVENVNTELRNNSEIKLENSNKKTEKPNKVSTTISNSDEDGMPKYNKISQYILRRMKFIEEQYKRIVSACSKNSDLMRELNEKSLIPQIRELKVFALVKEKQSIEQKNRFERYKRCLLSSVKEYRQSCIEKKKQYDELQSLYIPIVLELKILKNYFAENYTRIQTSSSKYLNQQSGQISSEVIQRIENLTEKIQDHIKSEADNPSLPERLSPSSDSVVVLSKEQEMNEQSKLEKRTILASCDTVGKKLPPISSFPVNLIGNENISENIISLREQINIFSSLIDNLRREKSILQEALQQRDHLLGKIFVSFKRKLEGVATEINEKYFLQRLCNDLRSVIKIYGGQNKIMKEALENNNICTKTIYIQSTVRRKSTNDKEEHVRELLRQQKDFCEIRETFSDIHSHLKSMKKDVSMLQNVLNKR